MAVTQHFADSFLEQIFANGTGAHRMDFLLEHNAVCFDGFVIFLEHDDRAIERQKPNETTFTLNGVIREIKAQAKPDEDDNIFADQGTMLEQFVHPYIESQTIPRIKAENIIFSVA